MIDFRRDKDGIPATVKAIEYDPNRTCFIALLYYADGEKRYILSPLGLKVGDTIMSGETADIKPGNCLPISSIPLGTLIHNVEIKVGHGGQMVRSAGTSAQVMAKEGAYAQIRLPSGEVRKVSVNARASIGQVGNTDHSNVRIGKAGRSRHLGIRPTRPRRRHEPASTTRTAAARARAPSACPRLCPPGARRRRASRPASIASIQIS